MERPSDEKPYYASGAALDAKQLRAGLLAMSDVLLEYLGANVIMIAIYGWDSGLHPALCHKEMQVSLERLQRFLKDSMRQEILIPGISEFSLRSPEDMIRIEFFRNKVATFGEDLILQEKLWLSVPWKDYPMSRVDGKDVGSGPDSGNLWN